jgi:hypothetical protein
MEICDDQQLIISRRQDYSNLKDRADEKPSSVVLCSDHSSE